MTGDPEVADERITGAADVDVLAVVVVVLLVVVDEVATNVGVVVGLAAVGAEDRITRRVLVDPILLLLEDEVLWDRVTAVVLETMDLVVTLVDREVMLLTCPHLPDAEVTADVDLDPAWYPCTALLAGVVTGTDVVTLGVTVMVTLVVDK